MKGIGIKMEECKVCNLYNLDETIAKDYCLDTNSRIWKKECIYQIDEQKLIYNILLY